MSLHHRSGEGRRGRRMAGLVEGLEERRLLAAFTVTNTDASGPGSLFQALADANQNWGIDTITFNIPGEGVHVIAPSSLRFAEGVLLDGYTQPGTRPNSLAVGSNAALKIQLSQAIIVQSAAYHITLRGLVLGGLWLVDAQNVAVEGCYIGTDATGSTLTSGGSVNIADYTEAHIGGVDPASRNLIAGGVNMSHSSRTIIQGNYIGTDASGTRSLGNSASGVVCIESGGTIVGNLISGNGGSGIRMTGEDFAGPTVMGNLIGTDATGSRPLGNNGAGVSVWGIGLTAITGNTIAFNQGSGVALLTKSPYTASKTILGNRIWGNARWPIELAGGPAPNDPMDQPNRGGADTGPNEWANYPVLQSAIVQQGQTIVRGAINTRPYSDTIIELFSNDVADSSGYGQGQRIVGRTTVHTDTNGNASFTMVLPGVDLSGQYLAATATLDGILTSAFSRPLPVGSVRQGPVVTSFGIIAMQYDPAHSTPMVTVMGTFADGGSGTRHVTVDWGDGSAPEAADVQVSDGVFLLDHVERWNSVSSSIQARITDAQGVGDTASTGWGFDQTSSLMPLTTQIAFASGSPVLFSTNTAPRGWATSYFVKWDFGDGTIRDWADLAAAPGALSPTHVFSRPGSYVVRVYARSSWGSLATRVQRLEVQDSAAPLEIHGTGGDDDLQIVTTTVVDPVTHASLPGVQVMLNGQGAGSYLRPNGVRVYGEEGNDRITLGADLTVLSVVYGGGGNDTITGGSGRSSLYGGAGNDSLTGRAGNDLIEGGEGDDTLIGGGGNDTLYGHDGADWMEGGAGDDELYGNPGHDTLYGGDGNDVVFGQGDDDLLYGNGGNDTLSGADGQDELRGGAGEDSLLGGLGGDKLYGGDGSDTISGGEGADYIEGKGKTDTIYGGGGHDTIYGGAGADWIAGEDGDDWIDVGVSAMWHDSVDGGAGRDTVRADGDDLLGGVEVVLG